MSHQEALTCRELLWFRFLAAQEMNSLGRWDSGERNNAVK
jgi:hypothetical protein